MPTFHVLIATIGRPTLYHMLESLLPQLTANDHVTIVFDGVTPLPITGHNVHIHHEPQALGYWGHGIRNKYAPLLEKTDFVMHADDDDVYTPGTFATLRRMCVDPSTLYVTRMLLKSENRLIPAEPVVREKNIGTPNGVIPYEKNKQSQWGPRVGGDGTFYEALAMTTPVVFLNVIAYVIRP
mgnify:CR=1 FL=1